MKKNLKTNITKTMRTTTTNALYESLSRQLAESSSSWIKSAIDYAERVRGDIGTADKLRPWLDDALDRESKTVIEDPLVILRDFTITITKNTRGGSTISENHCFSIVQHFPDEECYLVYLPADGKKLAAVALDRFQRIIKPISDAKTALEILDKFNRKAYLTGNNFHKMINVIQADTRDTEGNIYPSNRRRAKEIATYIKEATGIDYPVHVFMKTRGNPKKEEPKVDNFIYVGGFNIGDTLTVRIVRFIGGNNDMYNIYPIYIRYGSYAFITRLRYTIKNIEAFGGAGYGTAYKYLVDAKYLDASEAAITNIKNKSSMLNIYPFLKKLHDDESKQLELSDGTNTNVCDVILTNISKIITEKQLLKQTSTFTQNNIAYEPLTLQVFENTYNECMNRFQDLQRTNKGAVISYADVAEDDSTDESTDDDFNM